MKRFIRSCEVVKPGLQEEMGPGERPPVIHFHNEVWEPFQVVILEEIVQNGGETYIRVRTMYRPHDTLMSMKKQESSLLLSSSGLMK